MKKSIIFNDLLPEFYADLEELGYHPYYYDDSKSQLNCVINQSLFSIYPNDEDDTLLNDIITTITKKDGIIELIKSKSYLEE